MLVRDPNLSTLRIYDTPPRGVHAVGAHPSTDGSRGGEGSHNSSHLRVLVEVRGFEPLASAVRRQRSTGLSYTPGTSGSVAEVPHTSGRVRGRSSAAWRSSASRRSFCTTEIDRSPRVFSIRERETSVARRRFIVIASG